jgi:RNA polymerase sigma-70 factor, ECF subfamily
MCANCPTELARDVDAAFASLVAHHQDLVYGVARRLVRDPADAEDLAQDTFVRAYRALRGYAPERIQALHLRGWLARICLNLARNRARRADVRADPVPMEAASEVHEEAMRQPEHIAERRAAVKEWSRLLAGLPSDYGMAVGLRHVQGLSYQELALVLGRPVGTVKSDVHRGVALLRAAYEREQTASSRAASEVTR